MRNLGRVFGNSLIGEFSCVQPCDFRITPRKLEEDQDTFSWKKVNRQDGVIGIMLAPLCQECGKELTYDEAA